MSEILVVMVVITGLYAYVKYLNPKWRKAELKEKQTGKGRRAEGRKEEWITIVPLTIFF